MCTCVSVSACACLYLYVHVHVYLVFKSNTYAYCNAHVSVKACMFGVRLCYTTKYKTYVHASSSRSCYSLRPNALIHENMHVLCVIMSHDEIQNIRSCSSCYSLTITHPPMKACLLSCISRKKAHVLAESSRCNCYNVPIRASSFFVLCIMRGLLYTDVFLLCIMRRMCMQVRAAAAAGLGYLGDARSFNHLQIMMYEDHYSKARYLMCMHACMYRYIVCMWLCLSTCHHS
jgi:hypothetical protein